MLGKSSHLVRFFSDDVSLAVTDFFEISPQYWREGNVSQIADQYPIFQALLESELILFYVESVGFYGSGARASWIQLLEVCASWQQLL